MRSCKGPVAEMRRQAERMTAIIRDLLELSRLEETDEIVGGDPVDVAALASLLRKDVLARPVHPQGRARAGREPGARSSATSRKSIRPSPTWSTTPPSTPPPRARSRSAGGSTTTAATLPSPTPASASRRSTSRASPSASTAWMPAARASPAARVSGSPSSSTCCSVTGRPSRCRARSACGSTFTCHFPPERLVPLTRPASAATA